MTTAYDCVAKYVILFNYFKDDNNPFGTLENEHFQALQDFCEEVIQNPEKTPDTIEAETAFVLPKDYACGLRWYDDKIWGVLTPNETSVQIRNDLQRAVDENGFYLDIVYDES